MKKTLLACGLGAVLALSGACGDDGGGSSGGPDANVPGDEPDAGGAQYAYPPGPYGEGVEDTIMDIQWVGFIDGDDAGSDPFDEPPKLFRLAEFFQDNDPGAKVIQMNSAAGWCGPCMAEASEMAGLAGEYEPRGVRFITAIFEDAEGDPAHEAFVEYWGNNFNLTIPTMIDSTFQMGAYFDINAMPMNMWVDARDMKILSISVGYGGDGAFRQILDYYLSQQP